jgi:hypothetical protein
LLAGKPLIDTGENIQDLLMKNKDICLYVDNLID